MKIQIVSDLHLEFQKEDWPRIPNVGSDVLILGGDICLAEHLHRNPTSMFMADGSAQDLTNVLNSDWHGWDARRYRDFFKHVNDNWQHVVYVMGNHEHYSGRWERTESVLREELRDLYNVRLLEQERLDIDGVTFLGASLWTDFNGGDPLSMLSARDVMSDYRAISDLSSGQYRKLAPQVTYAKHLETRAWLRHMLSENKGPTVVVTHHAPSTQSIHPRYISQGLMNGMFVSNCEDIIMDNPHVIMWTHGHVHDSWDYKIGDTRIVCNPHGYPGERKKDMFDPGMMVEI